MAARAEPVGQCFSVTDSRQFGGVLPARAALARLLHHPPALTCKCLLDYSPAVGDVFKALADATRRAILDELTDRNGQTLFELCSRLTMKHGVGSSRQAISQHLDVLEEAGLVITRRDGRYKFHFIDTTPLRAIDERWPGQTQETQ